MARGKRNNRRGRGGHAQNTTNDSDANLSNIGRDGNGDVLNHKGFSTGAFGTSDIDGSGLQPESMVERSEMERRQENAALFREEVQIPSRSRTSSLGIDDNERFLNPNDYAMMGQNSQSSVRSRTSISNFERAHRISQLSIQTNNDEFVLVPGSGGHDGHASVRSMRSQVSRQSANVAMSSRDDILTEGDETVADELREEATRARLDSRASQLSRGSTFGAAVEIPIADESTAGYRSRRHSENANEEWEKAQAAQDKRSHTSLYSHKSNGWNERETQNNYVHVPSHHASRASVHSRVAEEWDETSGGFGEEEEIITPRPLSRHHSRISVMSHRSNVAEDGGDIHQLDKRTPSHHTSRLSVTSHRSVTPEETAVVEGSQFGQVHVPSHHTSKHSVYSSASRGGTVPRGGDGRREETRGAPVDVPARDLSRGPSRSTSKTSVKYDTQMSDDWDNNEQIFGGGGVSHTSRHSLHSGYGSKAPSHHASKTSIHSHAGGDAGIAPFTLNQPHSVHSSRVNVHSHQAEDTTLGNRTPSHHGSRTSMYSHPPVDNVYGSRAPSHHTSKASIHSHTAGDTMPGSRTPSHRASRARLHSHVHGDEDETIQGGMNGLIVEEEGGNRSRSSTRSQLSCIACADDEEREEGGEEKEKYGLPQLGDEIQVPPQRVDEWGDRVDVKMEEQTGYEEMDKEWETAATVDDYVPERVEMENRGDRRGRTQQRSAYGSMASLGSHAAAVPSIGGRSHHASRMSMRSALGGMEENDDGGRGLQQAATAFGGSAAPIPAIRLSRASLNQPTMDWNHNSMGNLNEGVELTDEYKLPVPSHHSSKMSLRSVRSELPQDPTMQTALSHLSIHSHQPAHHRDRRFSSRSTQDAAEWGETVKDDEEEEEEEVFEHHGRYHDELDGGMSRGTSHRSIYSTRSSKAGEQTEENLLQARLNRSREPSLASLADRPYIPPKDGWKSSAYSVKSTNEEEKKNRIRRSSVHLVGRDIDLRDEVVIPIPKTRSRSASIASRRSFEGVVFADQPELYSHPDDRFGGDKSIEGIPFRRTNEHEKTPQPSSKRGSRVYKNYESEGSDELRALVSSASVSHTSVVDNTPPPSAGFQTPKSRSSRESYLGTAEISMPSPSPFNQTQFQRDEYEAHKEREARGSLGVTSTGVFIPFSPSSQHDKSEMATQTGETIARAAGQRFALHYGGDEHFTTQSAKPRRGNSGVLAPSVASSSHSLAPPPPACSPPHEDEPVCTLQHHQPMEEDEERRRHSMLYDHGDVGGEETMGAARKSSSHSSSRFAPLPAYDMSYVEQHEARSMASASKTRTTSSVSSSTLHSQHSQYATAASAASSYVQHLPPVHPSPAHTNVNVRNGGENRGDRGGHYTQDMSHLLFSPSKGTVAQKAAVFRQKEEAERVGGHQEYNPVYKTSLLSPHQGGRTPVTRQVPIEMVRGTQVVVPPQKEIQREQPKVVNVEIKRAPSSTSGRPMQQTGYVHIERPKMNNSFERNNHPAAAALNSLLSARASGAGSPNSTRSEENPVLSRQSSTGGGGSYLPQRPMSYVPPAPPLPSVGQTMGIPKGVMTSPTSGYQRSIRPLASEDATFHYEMKHDLTAQQMFEKRMSEEISKDEQSVLNRVGALRADVSPQGAAQMRQPMRSREAEKAYNNYHDKKSTVAPSVPLTSVPKPFTPASPYRSVALGQQQQVYGAFRAQPVESAPIKKAPHMQSLNGDKGEQKEKTTENNTAAHIEQNKYTGSTIRRAIPQRGHIRNLAAAFDTIQTKADREVTVIEPHNSSGLQRSSGRGRGPGSTSSTTSSARGFAPRCEGIQQNGGGERGEKGGQETAYRVPVQLTGTTTSGSTRMEEYEMRRTTAYNERNIHEWQTANEQQMRQRQQREENVWSAGEQEEEEELCLVDSESDRPPSMHSGGRRHVLPSHVLRTSTPLAGVRNDPSKLERALEKIPSIRGDDTLGRGRTAVRGVRQGGVRALASRFEKAVEEEQEKARSASMTPRMRRRESTRPVDGEGEEDRREAAARRLSRGTGGVERLERLEKEKKRSQSAQAGMRKRRTSSTSDSGEESVMREMEAVERMAREEILKKEREEMRQRKALKGGGMKMKNEVRRPSEEERKIDEMFHGLESQESAGEERRTIASSRGTMSGTESVRTDRREGREGRGQREELHNEHHHYQYQQKYREHHHDEQQHLYQSHVQSAAHGLSSQQGGVSNVLPRGQQESVPSVSHYLAAHLHPIGVDGGVEGGVRGVNGMERRESTHTMHTTHTHSQSSSAATGLVYSPSVYRETGRVLRGDGSSVLNGSNMMMQLPVENGRIGREGRATTLGGDRMDRRDLIHNMTTASSPHFSPVNIRGPETAGQRVATYESKDGRNPVRVPSRQVRPYALATSTPMGTVHSTVRGGGGGGGTMMTEEGVVIPPEAVEDDSFLSTISGESRGSGVGRSAANQAEYKKQIARLQTVQSMEEEKISITSKALAHARKKQNPNNELAAQRTILLARLRVAALKRELQRLSALAIVRNPPPPVNKSVLGAMDISDITLHLNRNLCAKPTDGGSCSFGFIVVLKCGVEVEATAPVCLLVPQRPAGVKVVHFPEHLRFSNLPVDFTIRLEVYVMKLREPKEESCTALLATKARNLLGTPSSRRAITAGPGGSSGSAGSPSALNGELPIGELVRCGHTALDRDSVGSIRLYLDAPEYPLEGTIELASSYRCSRLPSSVDLDLRGFLTMYKVVGGYGSWVRYWAVLRRGVINFWKYPDDEQLDRGGPVASADLSKCTDTEIVPASREICTRQFAFSIDMLVATTPSIVEKKRVLLAADARDQLKTWLTALNETLAAIRA